MDKKVKQVLAKYYSLRDEIDTIVKKLQMEHKQHLKCKKKCSSCCENYRILPVEFWAIATELKEEIVIRSEVEPLDKNICHFLKNNLCLIYQRRPVICRTHGLPLLFSNDDGQWELSICDLNFQSFPLENFNFGNTLLMDKINSRLYMINQEFISAFKSIQYGERDLIPIENLSKYLNPCDNI